MSALVVNPEWFTPAQCASVEALKAAWFARPTREDANARWLDGVTDTEFDALNQAWFGTEDRAAS